MKLRGDLKLRKVGRQYMIVDVSDGRADLSVVYTMNETAAELWMHIGNAECDVNSLADWMCSEFDVDRERAVADIERQIEDWNRFGLMVQ